MQADVFRDVRERVPAKEAFQLYGIAVNARGLALCPFHADTRPSVSFKGERFKCFACGESGDATDFVSKYFGISGVEAVRKIDADFSLGLCHSARDHKEVKAQQAQLATAHAAFEAWRDTMIRCLNAVCYMAHAALLAGAEPSARQSLAIRKKAEAEYYADTLEAGTPEEQAQIYRERRELTKWIEKILKD